MDVELGRFQGKPKAQQKPDSKPTFTRGDLLKLHAEAHYLRQVAEELGVQTPGTFAAYDQHGVLPTHVHRLKGAHVRALQLLTKGLREARRDPAEPRMEERL